MYLSPDLYAANLRMRTICNLNDPEQDAEQLQNTYAYIHNQILVNRRLDNAIH